MKKTNHLARQFSPEREAINSLSIISEKQTCYLKDWGFRKNKEGQGFQSKLSSRPSHSNIPTSSMGNCQGDSHQAYNLQFNTLKPDKKSKSNITKDLISAKLGALSNAVPLSDAKRIRKSELQIYRKLQSQGQFFSIAHYSLHHPLGKDQIQRDEKRVVTYSGKTKHPEQMSKQLKQRHVSLPWLKPVGVDLQSQVLDKERKKKIEVTNLNEIIKNKLKRRNRYIFHKQSNPKQEKDHESDDKLKSRQKIAENNEESNQKNQIKMLKNWIEHSKSKKKMSITSLLNEHFEKKYLEKKREREKALGLKSLKAISSLAHIQYKLML